MRASRLRDFQTHCPYCLMRREICICPILPAVKTKTEFLILRHIWEVRRPGNTGRLVALAMPNSRIIDCGGGERVGSSFLKDKGLTDNETWLLWPDGHALRHDTPDTRPPQRVVVLDATWHQARRLFRQNPLLQTMPRLSLPAPSRERRRLRKQQRPDGMSTLECVAAAVALLEGDETARPLEHLFDEVVRRKINMRWGNKHFPDQSESSRSEAFEAISRVNGG